MSAGTLVLRVAPVHLLAPRRAGYLVSRNLLVARRSWILFVSGFFEPFFYLLSVGIGIGGLVGRVVPDSGPAVGYEQFVAPGLLAASAMNGAIYDSLHNVYFKLRYAKLYDAVLATPLSPQDAAVGEIAWAVLRGATYSAAFLLVMLGLGLIGSPWALLALPAAVLVGFAFAAVGMALATFVRSWQDLDLVQLAILPLFLFSTTFYPLSVYPAALQWFVRCTPLYHGIELLRGLVTGAVHPGLLGDVAYLLLMGALGLLAASRRLAGLMLR